MSSYDADVLFGLKNAREVLSSISFQPRKALIDKDGSGAMKKMEDLYDESMNIHNKEISSILKDLKQQGSFYDTVIIADHGNETGIYLGGTKITMDNISEMKHHLEELGVFIKNRLILAQCNTGKNETLLKEVARIMNVEIVASDYYYFPSVDTNLHGDWLFVSPDGQIEKKGKFRVPADKKTGLWADFRRNGL